MNRFHKTISRPRISGLVAIFALLFVSCAHSADSSANSNANSNSPNNSNSQSDLRLRPGNPNEPTPAPTPGRVVQINKDPKTLVLAFYEYYLDGFPRIDDERVVFARYLTPRFFDEALKADDYDPFLDAQDFDETWKNNISAADARIRGNVATVRLSLNGKSLKWVLDVTAVKKGGVWKIDRVKNIH